MIRELVKEFALENADPAALAAQVVDGKKGKWQALADDAWFKSIERRVDQDFRRLLRPPAADAEHRAARQRASARGVADQFCALRSCEAARQMTLPTSSATSSAASLVHGHAHRADPRPHPSSSRSPSTRRRACRSACRREGHEHHFVAGRHFAIPRAVLADEHAVRHRIGQRVFAGSRPGPAPRRARPARSRAAMPWRPGPAVAARRARRRAGRSSCRASHRSRPVSPRSGSQARDRCPARRVHSRPSTAGRSPAPRPCRSDCGCPWQEALLARGHIHFPDGRAALLFLHAVLGHVAVGAHGGIQLARRPCWR